MIAHPLKTVFVHIPKTAGYSIEQVFLSYLGLEQSSRAALLLREKLGHESGPPRLSHLKAGEYKSCGFLTEKQNEEYYFFTVVRNPWTRVKSFYRYLKFDQTLSLNEFVEKQLEKEMRSGRYNWFMRPQTEFIYDSRDKSLVHTICRFEQLQTDFNVVLESIGLPITELPMSNASQVYQLRNVVIVPNEDLFSKASIDKIANLYDRDIELLGYDC